MVTVALGTGVRGGPSLRETWVKGGPTGSWGRAFQGSISHVGRCHQKPEPLPSAPLSNCIVLKLSRKLYEITNA